MNINSVYWEYDTQKTWNRIDLPVYSIRSTNGN